VQRALFAAEMADAEFRWRCVHAMDLNLSEIRDGYIPDLIILDAETSAKAKDAHARHLLPEQVEMVVEVIDRAPRTTQAVLYSDPDPGSGAYLHFESWKFGETIRLPDPFGFEIATDGWGPWDG
jgi:hypothetical protein